MYRLLAVAFLLVAVHGVAAADAVAADSPSPSPSVAPPAAIASPAALPASAPTPAASASAPAPTPTPEPARREGYVAPMDPLFPSADFNGPIIGVNVDPTGLPLETGLAKYTGAGRWLDQNRIRLYGWIDAGYEGTNTSSINTFPISYNPVANRIQLDQAVLRIERDPDTVQQDHADWGFRISNIYGVDYRWTTAYGYFSGQLATNNQLNGYDNPESFFMLYEPHLFKGGSIIQIGRIISMPDIEAQLAPQNYIYSHSIMFDWDSYTATGILVWSKLSPMFSIDYGVTWGDDVAPFTPVQHFPTGQAFVKYTTKANKDNILFGVDAYNNEPFTYYVAGAAKQSAAQCAAYESSVVYAEPNGTIKQGIPPGTCLYGHDNLQQQNLTWYHAFSKDLNNAFETYYLWTRNAPGGGSISNGPLQYAAGGGPGAFISGRSTAIGMVDYFNWKFAPDTFLSFRSDYINDPQGWRTGYRTSYGSLTLSFTHHFDALTWIRPEIRTEKAFAKNVFPYDNLEALSNYGGTKNYQNTFGVDLIQWF
jgi:hypothetical protein